MKTRSFAIARALSPKVRVHRSRKKREGRKADRLFLAVAGLVLIAVGVSLVKLTPTKKPTVTVYMRSDCESCRSWMRYLESHGFRTEVGAEADWPAIRARFKLPPRFRGRHTAVVDGLLLEGHVPAGEIHAALAKPDHAHIRGLVVPGLPRDAPGLPSAVADPYLVFAMQDSGLMRPISTHHEILTWKVR